MAPLWINGTMHDSLYQGGNNVNSAMQNGVELLGADAQPVTIAPDLSDFMATTTSDTITVSWTRTGSAPTTYTIRYGTNASVLSDFGGTTATLTDDSFSLSSLLESTTYYFRIYAENSAGSDTLTGSAATVATPTFSGNITYTLANNVTGVITPTSYANQEEGSTIAYSGTLTAATGFQFGTGLTTMAVAGNITVPSGGGDITVNLSGFTVGMRNFRFEEGVDLNSFAVDITGTPTVDVIFAGITVTFNPAMFLESESDRLRSSTVSFVVPAGFGNTGDTLSRVLSATQPGTAPPATAGTIGDFTPAIVNIPAAGANGTYDIDVTPDNGNWEVVDTGAMTASRNGAGDRNDVSWSIAANTAATERSGTITLNSSDGTQLDQVNWSQEAAATLTVTGEMLFDGDGNVVTNTVMYTISPAGLTPVVRTEPAWTNGFTFNLDGTVSPNNADAYPAGPDRVGRVGINHPTDNTVRANFTVTQTSNI